MSLEKVELITFKISIFSGAIKGRGKNILSDITHTPLLYDHYHTRPVERRFSIIVWEPVKLPKRTLESLGSSENQEMGRYVFSHRLAIGGGILSRSKDGKLIQLTNG